jgi:hypothetical protein
MVLHHFLMVTSALIGRSCLDSLAHHDIDLHESPLSTTRSKVYVVG